MKSVFLVMHETEYDDVKLIGVYRSRDEASHAVVRVRDKPGFRDGGEFHISEYEVGKDHWAEGFGDAFDSGASD